VKHATVFLFTLVTLSAASVLAAAGGAGEPHRAPERGNASGTHWLYRALEINYVALNALDVVTTFWGMDRGARERNPLAKRFVRHKPLALMLKGGATATVLFGLGKVKARNKPAAYITLGLLNVVYGVVLHNNIGVVLRL